MGKFFYFQKRYFSSLKKLSMTEFFLIFSIDQASIM